MIQDLKYRSHKGRGSLLPNSIDLEKYLSKE
jgi:hypothetical protein